MPLVGDWTPESDEDRERLLRMLRLSAAALKVRDGEAAAARNAEQAGVPDCRTGTICTEMAKKARPLFRGLSSRNL